MHSQDTSERPAQMDGCPGIQVYYGRLNVQIYLILLRKNMLLYPSREGVCPYNIILPVYINRASYRFTVHMYPTYIREGDRPYL